MRIFCFLVSFLREFKRYSIVCSAIVLFSLLAPSQAARRGIPTVVDTDLGGGLGDLLALTLAVRSPQLDVVGVITASATDSERSRAISQWLKFLDRPDIKVGEGGPVGAPPTFPSFWPTEPSAGSPLSASQVITAAVEANGPALLALVMGPGSALAEALVNDPKLTFNFQRIVWTRPSSSESPFSGFNREGEIGSILFDATVSLAACDASVGEAVELGPEDWITLGRSRSALAEEITYRAARSKEGSQGGGSQVRVPHVLTVIAAAGITGVSVEKKWVQREPSGAYLLAATGERAVSVVSSSSPEAVRKFLLRELANPALDFRVDFAHFLNSLLRLDPETKEALKGKLDLPMEPNDQDKKTGRERMLEYLENKLRVLKESGRPSVASTLGYLESAYLAYAGVGWWFPDPFYTNWNVDLSTEKTLRFGVANSGELRLNQVTASVRIGEASLSQSVESTTDTATFEFDLSSQLNPLPQSATAELRWRFESGGGMIERSRVVELSGL